MIDRERSINHNHTTMQKNALGTYRIVNGKVRNVKYLFLRDVLGRFKSEKKDKIAKTCAETVVATMCFIGLFFVVVLACIAIL